MYAIIDVETTGGNPKRERVTEIAILIHNGQRVIDQYCTLVNPEQWIPPYITSITGITNEMVAEAPTWAEIADRVEEMTTGRVFIAHNARFDYTFICNEFKRMERSYRRKQLCTVSLSRRILPGLPSYSLGRICDSIGIPIEHRHRAFGDAAATAELFDVLLRSNASQVTMGLLKEEINASILPPNISREVVDELPEEAGIYYFRDARGKILYIGKSTNIRKRVLSHFSGDMNSKKYHSLKNAITSIDHTPTGSELIALLMESDEIKRWMPEYNVAQRRRTYKFGIFDEPTLQGYRALRVATLKLDREPLMYFSTRRGAEMRLEGIAQKFGLCPSLCGLHEGTYVESNCGEGICNGACKGHETLDLYNTRVEVAFDEGQFEHSDFLLIGEGRRPGEVSLVLVEESHFVGYGYAEENEPLHNLEAVRVRLTSLYPNRELRNIIRSQLSNVGRKLRLVPVEKQVELKEAA